MTRKSILHFSVSSWRRVFARANALFAALMDTGGPEPEVASFTWRRVVLSGMLQACFLFGATPVIACSVCFSVSDEARKAYYLTTALMIVVPLSLLAGILIWLYRAYSRHNSSERDDKVLEAESTRES